MDYSTISKEITIDNGEDPAALSKEALTMLQSIVDSETDLETLYQAATGDELIKLRILRNTIKIQKAILKILSNK